jgi:hypothetical protein
MEVEMSRDPATVAEVYEDWCAALKVDPSEKRAMSHGQYDGDLRRLTAATLTLAEFQPRISE